MTAFEALKKGEEVLQQADITEWRNDAWMLFEYVTGINRTSYLINKLSPLDDNKISKYQELIEIRAKRIPLQQITNCAYFMGHEFYVNENVLIPRQDTEVLVENVLKLVSTTDNCRILDMCTGSGCIIISLMLALKSASGVGSDISHKALEVARKNATQLGVEQVTFVNGNLFESVEGEFDIIVSNPPYIKTEVIDGLMEEVKLYEPYIALDGLSDGLHFYREISRQSVDYLKAGGYLCYEIGYDQGEAVRDIMISNGYEDIVVIKDLAGLDRVVIGRRRK